MRGRCELHQLALGPGGCVLCRREGPPLAAVPSLAAQVSSTAVLQGAEEGGAPVTADAASAAFATARQVNVQVPGIALLLPLVAAAFYFFAFFAGDESSGPVRPESELSQRGASPPAPVDGHAVLAVADERARPSFRTLVIEEPSPPSQRPLDVPRPQPTAPAATTARTNAGSARAIESTRADAEARELAELRERVDVTVYSTAWCPACRSLRDYLARRGIRATEYDIERNRSARARQRELNPRGGVPTVEIDGQVLVGFSPRSIEAALDRAARARQQRL